MKKKHVIATVAIIVLISTSVFIIEYFTGSEKVVAYSEEHIKQSMQDTEQEKENFLELHGKVHEKLKEEGYKGNVSFSFRHFSSKPPEFTVRVKNQEYKDDYGNEIKKVIRKLAEPYQLGKFDIQIKLQFHDRGKVSEKDQKLIKRTDEVFNITNEVLRQEGIKFNSIGADLRSKEPTIQIEIPGTEAYYNSVKNDIERLVHEALHDQKHLDIKVKITRETNEEIRDRKWQPIFTSIIDETDKRFDMVTGFAYSFHPMPLQIIIKTSLSDGWFSWGENEQVKKIEKYVKQVIEIKRNELSIEKIPYKIIVRGKEQHKLN